MNSPKGKILVNGSVVIDTILEEEFFGGTAANIAYGLGTLKALPILFSVVGKDFKKDFHPHLKKSGVDVRVRIDPRGKTSRSYYLTNNDKQPNVIWQPNAYKKINKISLAKYIGTSELKKVSIAIFSLGTPESTYKHIRELRNYAPKALIIFDPGPLIHSYSKKKFMECMNLSDIFIVNEIEYKATKKILGQDPRKIIKGKTIIETRGGKGSIVFSNGKIIKVLAVKPKKIIDLTGAGDAYRAGLIFGLWKGFTLAQSCTLGARLAAKNIACVGCQRY